MLRASDWRHRWGFHQECSEDPGISTTPLETPLTSLTSLAWPSRHAHVVGATQCSGQAQLCNPAETWMAASAPGSPPRPTSWKATGLANVRSPTCPPFFPPRRGFCEINTHAPLPTPVMQFRDLGPSLLWAHQGHPEQGGR